VVPGQLHIASTDGSELDLGPGDAYRLEPGHDAWVTGDEPFVALEFESKTAETPKWPAHPPSDRRSAEWVAPASLGVSAITSIQ
jgi:hypothetical protein